MVLTPPRWTRLFLAGMFLIAFGGQVVLGQGQYPQSSDERGRQTQVPSQAQGNEPLIQGVTVAFGLAIYQGDYSLNPNHNPVKYIAGNGNLSARVGIDHRLGQFDQYGLGIDVVYSRLSGESGKASFTSNSVAMDVYADYELPYISEGLFRVFLGGGPNLIVSPSYEGVPRAEENYEPLGTRVIGSLKAGVTIMDSFRIGTRIASSDLLDGYKGSTADGVPDFVSFLNIGYRFSLN